MMLSSFSRSFFPAVVGSLYQLAELRDGEVFGRVMPYLKATATAGFWLA